MNIEEIRFKIKQKIRIKLYVHIGQPFYNTIVAFNRKTGRFKQHSTTELLNYNMEDCRVLEEIKEW